MSYKEEALNPDNKYVLKDGVIKIVYGKKKKETTRTVYGERIKEVLDNHYEWCKANGRDTSWYGEYKRVSTRKKNV